MLKTSLFRGNMARDGSARHGCVSNMNLCAFENPSLFRMDFFELFMEKLKIPEKRSLSLDMESL